MKSAAVSQIALVQAAYDLEAGPQDWLPNLLEAGGNILDRGRGCTAATWAGTSCDGPLVSQLHSTRGDRALASRFACAAVEALESLDPQSAEDNVHTLAQSTPLPAARDAPGLGCADMLSLWAVDDEFHGVGIYIPSDNAIAMSPQARRQLRKLLTHIEAGYRLRKELGLTGRAVPLTDYLRRADCASGQRDPTAGDPCNVVALRALRKAAINLDVRRTSLRTATEEMALNVRLNVMDGSCSIVDCFDTGDRRFVLVRPNAPDARDPRGLTEREYQVAKRAGIGESSKLIAYTLGLSTSRVSALLQGAMRKLGVRNRQQLVLTMRTLLV